MLDGQLVATTASQGARWLTVGDYYFGMDAHSLLRRGAGSVLATDIAEKRLKIGKEKGLIHEYKALNADVLDLPSNSVDFAFCKEAFHHFPRPMRSLYELMRVAKRGVLLIEPNEIWDGSYPMRENWEFGTGNWEYQYRLNVREVTKSAWVVRNGSQHPFQTNAALLLLSMHNHTKKSR